MTCIKIPDGILCMVDITFKCTKCNRQYCDSEDKYTERINKNKSGMTKIKCSCGNTFGVTYDYKGNLVSYDL